MESKFNFSFQFPLHFLEVSVSPLAITHVHNVQAVKFFFYRTLHIVWKNVIRVYSTQTGDFVREFEPLDYRIAGIIAHPDNTSVIIGCTENGELYFWNCQSGIITKKLVRV